MKQRLRIYISLAFFLINIQFFAKAPILTFKEINTPPPRIIRTCCGFGADIGFIGVPFVKKTDITTVETMGNHVYLGGKDEQNGIIYTKKGGFIDLGHLRDCADWTAYLYNLILASKENREWVITELRNEGGAKSLILRIPENFNKKQSCELAGKIAYDLSVWHEISTWFGASYVPLVPEKFSSFSPEDLYSNLMGVHLGMMAINSDLDYDEAMTYYLSEMLYDLESVTTVKETYDAMVKVDQLWYTSDKRYPNKKLLLKRYFDEEQKLVPWLVPGEESILPPYVLIKPDEDLSDLFQLNIKLNFKFPVKSIFTEESDRIVTQKDFDILIDYIQAEIIQKELKEAQQQESKEKKIKRKEI